MGLLFFLLVSAVFSEDFIRLECGRSYTLWPDSDFLISSQDPSFYDRCNISINPSDQYIVPFLALGVFSKSFDEVIVTSDDTDYGIGRIASITPGLGNTSFYWIPIPFYLTFYFATNPISQFEIYISAQDIQPNRTAQLIVYDDGSITFLDSEFLTPSRTAIRLFDAQNKTIQVRGFNYPEETWVGDDMDSLLIYSDGNYICTAKDMIQAGSHTATVFSIKNSITVISRDPQGRPGITFLASLNYTFPGEVQVRALSQSDGPIPVDATFNSQVIHYAAPRLSNTIRYSTHFTFIGNGTLTFYAGAITGPRDNLLLAEITDKTSALSVPLVVKGRGRTLTLDYGQVVIDSDMNFKNSFCVVKEGQRGVFMSSNYPYSSSTEEFDGVKFYGEHDEIFKFQAEILAPGLRNGDFLTLGVKAVNGTNQSRSFTGPSQENFTATGTQFYIRYTIGPQSDGMLIRYSILSPDRATSTKNIAGKSHLIFILLVSSIVAV